MRPRRRPRPPETNDAVFRWLENRLPVNLGDVLDAGTGPDSLKWLAGCTAEAITAVTASKDMKETTMEEAGAYLDSKSDTVVVGNWLDKELLPGRRFDTIVADYLLGSVEFFSPHFQTGLLRRLGSMLRPGGWLAIAGKEPEDLEGNDSAARLVLDAEALRDAAMMLGRQRTYREMPRWWVTQELLTMGLEVQAGKVFPRRVTLEKVERQLAWAEEELAKVPHEQVRSSLLAHLHELRARAEGSAALRRGYVFGQDYALVAMRTRPSPGLY